MKWASLNKIRNHVGLQNTTASDKDTLSAAIEKERQVELYVEWRHRWLDLRTPNSIEAILTPIKPGWQSARATVSSPCSRTQ